MKGDHRVSQPVIDLDVVVPVFNEEQRLGPTLRALTAHAATLPLSVRFTVVDNGSVDRTAEVVDDVAARSPENTSVRLIGCSRQGKGAAVRRGLLAGTARWRGFCDADLSTPPQVLTDVVGHLQEGDPVVIGSRRITGAGYEVAQPLLRRLGSSTFRMMTRPLVGDVADTQCGFKFFSAEAAEQIFSRVTANGFAFDVEVLAVAARLGLPVTEVPVRWTDQEGSSFHVWTHGRRVLSEVRAVHAALGRMA
ncbi:glycosyl transferase family 2 [Modestobacter versicolor]|uniref:dolichyl-phosphate beta-glucosyltransferase n=1 Tax=Modestobacter versicolor TaxID=429133 RepID=A0A323VF53_9ACTN|nr:glycosyl transferase family 2 [Modestobacter versicolor]